MEPSTIPVMSKKLQRLIRVIFFMLKHNISKSKLMINLNMTIKKRGKIATKAFQNLLFHHTVNPSSNARDLTFNNVTITFNINHHSHFFSCARACQTDDNDDVMAVKFHEMVSEATSPELPGFGRTPMVRQLRVTDSPFPLCEGDSHVDAAAEDFINKFYNELRRQNNMTPRY